MKRILKIIGLFAVLVVGGIILRWTIFLDLERFRADVAWQAAASAPADFTARMAHKTHRGDGPCLRYIDPAQISDTEMVLTNTEARTLGVAAQLRPLFPLFMRWAQETDAPHHATDQAEELLLATRDRLHGIDRWILTLNFKRVLKDARNRDTESMSRLVGEAEGKVDPATREKLHQLWQHHPIALSLAGYPRFEREVR